MSNNIARYQPRGVLSLQDAMDRLFDQSFLSPYWGGTSSAQTGGPAVDVVETNEDVIVTAAVPGIKADDLKITLSGDVLHLSGQTATETEHKDATYHLRERSTSSFSRAIGLPSPVIGDQAQADFENGVLTLKLPKAQEARAKAITVKAKP